MVKEPWALKYRPNTVDNYIFQNDNHKAIINKFIAEQSIPNLLFAGFQGTGKTTLAYILKNALGVDDSDFLYIEASTENSVDIVRYKIASFVNTIATGSFKLVLLDEADYLSGNAQGSLRTLLENPEVAANARFIFTSNYTRKIIGPLRSRLQEFEFTKISKDAALEKAAEILSKEKIKTTIEILEKYVDVTYPDFRKLTVLMEQNSVNGKLLDEPVAAVPTMDYMLEILDLLEKNNWQTIRTVVCDNVTGEQWVEVYKFIYEYIHEVGKFKDNFKWKQAIIIIADHLYKNSIVADNEINFIACIIRLTEV